MKDRADMTPERLQELLDRHGAELARWPEAERTAAQSLLASDARAQRMLAQASALEHALAGLPAPEPSAALRRAVAEIPLRHPLEEDARAAFAWLPLRSAWALCAAAALIAALGALSGALTSEMDLPVAAAAEAELQDEAADDPLTELTELAFAVELDGELEP